MLNVAQPPEDHLSFLHGVGESLKGFGHAVMHPLDPIAAGGMNQSISDPVGGVQPITGMMPEANRKRLRMCVIKTTKALMRDSNMSCSIQRSGSAGEMAAPTAAMLLGELPESSPQC